MSLALYGWIILLSTWTIVIVGLYYVIGTGSSYPDRSLEKITGTPIVNYYANLIVLSSVLAWVWCITSWVGLKFFSHARGGKQSVKRL